MIKDVEELNSKVNELKTGSKARYVRVNYVPEGYSIEVFRYASVIKKNSAGKQVMPVMEDGRSGMFMEAILIDTLECSTDCISLPKERINYYIDLNNFEFAK